MIRARCGSADAADKLSELVQVLEAKGFSAQAEEVLGIVPLCNSTCVERMRFVITETGAKRMHSFSTDFQRLPV